MVRDGLTPILAKEFIEAINPNFKKEFLAENEEGRKELVLRSFLRVAVPGWKVLVEKTSYQDALARAHEISRHVAVKGDIILYKSKKEGDSAAAFNALAEGIAILALMAEGGVSIFGEKWDWPIPKHWIDNESVVK